MFEIATIMEFPGMMLSLGVGMWCAENARFQRIKEDENKDHSPGSTENNLR